jgi:hypothetical protein
LTYELKNVEGSSSGLILMYYPNSYLEGLRKPRKIAIRIAGVQAEL